MKIENWRSNSYMSIYIRQGIYVTINQLGGESAPRPLPLLNGFTEGLIYEILGIQSHSESAEAFLILKNDRDEIWFISNRHVRVVEMPSLSSSNGNGHLRLQQSL